MRRMWHSEGEVNFALDVQRFLNGHLDEMTGIKAAWLASGERIGSVSVAYIGTPGDDGAGSVLIRRTNGNTLVFRGTAVVGLER